VTSDRPEPPPDQPPWWPHGEHWPPRSRRHRRRNRRSSGGRRAAARYGGCGCIFFAMFFALAILGVISLLTLIANRATPLDAGLATGATLGIWLLMGALVIVALGISAFILGRLATPIAKMSTAVASLEDGDYTARVPQPRWSLGPMRALVRAFNTMATRLEDDDATRRTLLADVSHELRNPLAVIQGELEAIQDGVHQPDEARIATLLGEVAVLSRLVDDLRTVTLAEAGTLALHPEPTDIAILLEDVASSYTGLAATDGVTLTTEVTQDLPLLELDPLRLREVLTNLVSNAVRHAGRPGTVTLTASQTEDQILLSVIDSGPGIDPAVLPRLFERFAKDPASPGFGLGLAIARGLVEAHGGTLTAASEVGQGTTMTVNLPLRTADQNR